MCRLVVDRVMLVKGVYMHHTTTHACSVNFSKAKLRDRPTTQPSETICNSRDATPSRPVRISPTPDTNMRHHDCRAIRTAVDRPSLANDTPMMKGSVKEGREESAERTKAEGVVG
jgi:hypothetical protein